MARSRSSRLSVAALVLAALAALVLAASPMGVAAGLWDFGFGFTLLRWAVCLGVPALALGIGALALALVRADARGAAVAGIALILAGVAAGVPLAQYRKARTVPPINDITTDPADPPEFVAAGKGAENGAAGEPYPRDEFAAQQRAAYADLETLRFGRPASEVFTAALATAREMPGWEVVLADPESGRIEATDTTPWFRFADDVVVRIRPEEGGGAVDVRSRSRVGVSDVGANAERIREFLSRLTERLGSGAT